MTITFLIAMLLAVLCAPTSIKGSAGFAVGVTAAWAVIILGLAFAALVSPKGWP